MGETNHCADIIVFDSEIFLKSCTWISIYIYVWFSRSLLSARHRCQDKQIPAPLTHDGRVQTGYLNSGGQLPFRDLESGS